MSHDFLDFTFHWQNDSLYSKIMHLNHKPTAPDFLNEAVCKFQIGIFYPFMGIF